PLASFLESSQPSFYGEYMLLRGRRSRMKKRSSSQLNGVEILGTVTKAGTNEAISGAVINIIGHDLVNTTDIDGYYLFDELPATEFVISCHCQGYQLPEQVVATASQGESLVVNFVLTPVLPSEPTV
ncbi:MAG: carboxypeptidase-like regulatory domain-containing protein, partial [Bacteroidales bacterium]|nr:carboxypeptidase-like regulatory domain-containing protein [Bacteroidales bacterium]